MTKWLDRRISAPAPYMCLCLSEKEYKQALKHCKVESSEPWIKSPQADATCHHLRAPNGLCAAAKAAGIEIYFDEDGDCYRVKESGNRKHWDPLSFDGDAFRLAVTLRLRIDIHSTEVWVTNQQGNTAVQVAGNDLNAATRRAIVRAAAAMGGTDAKCKACNGSGWVVRDQDIGTDQECFVCNGTGEA